jgi:SAM-dependent methyltransferase
MSAANSRTCNVCATAIAAPIYTSAGSVSITSLCKVLEEKTHVSFCGACGHLQTDVLAELDAYYDEEYKILIESEEEDQLYKVVGGKKIFRTEHQVSTLLRKVALPENARILDYGCAKSSTLKRLGKDRPDLVLHVHDVSDMYVPFWEKFIKPGNWSTYELKPEWTGSFDLVTSFFALEHVADPRSLARSVAGLLKPGGSFYCIVPNTYANTADFVVADHVNHFSEVSLGRLMRDAGMNVVSLDGSAHDGAWVLVARKVGGELESSTAPGELAELSKRAHAMADYWKQFSARVRDFESTHARQKDAAIYGSGFYGTFIATCLADFQRITCFLDQNPHRQAQTLLGKKIVSPEKLPKSVEVVYVGLNPQIARGAISSIESWKTLQLSCFFP